MNLALLVARTSGLLDLYDISGTLLYRHPLNFIAQHLSTTSGYDDIKILAGTSDRAVLLDLEMGRISKNFSEPLKETGLQVDYLNFSVTTDADLDITSPLCALQHYVKLGHKYWVLADCLGSFQILYFNGTQVRSAAVDKPILKFERFGQQLSFMSSNSVGHLLLEQLKTAQTCQLYSQILDMTIDSSYSISQLHVLLEDGELLVIDTANECRRIAKHFSSLVTPVSKVLSLRGATLVWTGVHLLYFDREEEPQTLAVQGGKGLLTSQRTQSGSTYIAIDTVQGVRLYEYVAPHKNTSSFDFGNLRFIVVVAAIALVVLWQVFRKRQTKEKTS
jgi:hypothetical protein